MRSESLRIQLLNSQGFNILLFFSYIYPSIIGQKKISLQGKSYFSSKTYLFSVEIYFYTVLLIIKIKDKMSSIRDFYTVVQKMETHGIEGYHVDSKYVDPVKIKQERELSKSRDKVTPRPNVDHKTSFIDEVVKREKKMPGPCTYEPKELSPKSKADTVVVLPKRKTIFDELEAQSKKLNIPAAGKYDRVELTDKSKLHSNVDKAEITNYIEGQVRASLDYPGVGSYNKYHNEDKRACKIVQGKTKRSVSNCEKLPPVGTYKPLPVSYQLFENDLINKKKYKSKLSREQRWKTRKQKTVPFYEVTSQWGMKNKLVNKDILTRLSSPTRSVYH